MDIRATLTDAQEKLAEQVATTQATSNREAVLNVFMRHGKQYTKKRIPGFSSIKMGRPKSKPSPSKTKP